MILQSRQVLFYFSNKYNGDFKLAFEAIKAKEKLDESLLSYYLSLNKANFVTLLDENYPECFKNIYNPPLVIYYYGDINLIGKLPILGVVGSRKITSYGQKSLDMLFNNLDASKEFALASGMAYGVDSYSQYLAIQNNIKVISVLGSGIEQIYPLASKKIYNYCKDPNNGLVISEYPNNVLPLKDHFPRRNSILASIITSLLVVEGEIQSGTSITVKDVLNLGKDILCIPNRIDSKYKLTNRLIKDGGEICLSIDDIYQSLFRYGKK